MLRDTMLLSLKTTAAPLALLAGLAAAGPVAAGPEGGRVTRGAAAISASGAETLVRQDSARALIEWDSFDIDAGEQVRYEQPGRGSVALNRVVGGGGASRIDGAIKANGNVWIVNRDGVAFGPSARIDVGGLLATTSDIRDDDFMAGRDRFTIPGAPGAAVTNAGEITFREAGLAALVGAHVENSGVIAGEVGTVLVGGRETLAVDLAGDGLFAFEFDAAALTGPDGASVVQTGEIVNPGGRVLVTAAGAAALVDNVVSVEGLIDVSGADGGSVEIAAPGGALTVSGDIRARGTAGDGGAVSVSGGDIVVRETARIDASGAAAGGFAPIVGEEALAFFGAVDVSGGTGPGGFVDTSAPLLTVGSSASIDASSIDGAAGLWLIDPIDLTITAGAAAVGEIDAGLIVTALSGGTDVTIQTANGGSVAPPGVDPGNLPGADPGEAGDITVATPLTGIDTTGAPSAPTLTLDADGGVFVNAPITQTDGAQPVSVTILSGGGGGDGIVVDTGGVPAIAVGGTVSFTALDPVDDHQPAIGDAGDVSILSDVQASFILIEADEQTQIRVTGDFNSGDGGFSALAIDNDDTPLATQVFIAADNADEIENAALSTFTQLDLLLDAPVTIVSTADPSSANPEFIDLDTLVSGSDVDSLSVIVASVAAGPAVTLREVNQPAVSLNLNARDGGDAVLDFDAAVTLGDLILQTPNGGDVIVSALAAAPNADRAVTITAPEIGDGLQFSAGSNTPGMGQIALENSPILISARGIDFSAQQGVQADASAPGPTITNGSGQIVIPDLSAFAAGATITSVGQITDAGSVAFGGPTTLEVLGGTPQGSDIVLDGVEFPAAADTILRAGTNEAPGGAGSVVIDEPASGGFQLAEVFARQSVSIRAEGVGAFDAATVGGGFATATFTEGDYGGVANISLAPDNGTNGAVLDIRDFGADTVTVEAENGSIDVANMDAVAGPGSATLIAQDSITFANSAFSTLAATATTGSVTGGVGAGAATFTAAVDVVVNGAFGSVGGSAGGVFSVNGSAGTFDAMAGQDLIAIGDLGTVRGTAGRDARINKNADVIFDTPLTLGPLTVTRNLDVDSIRSVVSGGAIVVGGVSEFTCVSGGDRCDVDLNDVANDFGGLVSIEAEDARIFDVNDLALDTVALVRDGDPTPDTTIDSIGQDDAFNFEVNVAAGALTHPSGQVVVARDTMITARDAVTLDLPADDFGGDFDAAADAEADGNDEEVSVVGPDAMTPAGAVTLRDVDDIVLGRVNVDSLTVTAGDDILDDGDSTPTAIEVRMATDLVAAADILLDTGQDTANAIHDFGLGAPVAPTDAHRVDATAPGDVILVDRSALRLGDLTVGVAMDMATGTLTAQAGGSILDSTDAMTMAERPISVEGAASLRASDGAAADPEFFDVVLDNVVNDFMGAVSIEAEDARIADANDLILEDVALARDADPTPDATIDSIGDAAQFNFEVNVAAGALTHPSGQVVVARDTMITARDAVTLDRPADDFGGDFDAAADAEADGNDEEVSVVGPDAMTPAGAVTLRDVDDIVLGLVNVDSLTVTAGDDILDDGDSTPTAIEVRMATDLVAAADILLDTGQDTANAIHDFGLGAPVAPTDAHRVDATAPGDVILVDRSALRLGDLTVGVAMDMATGTLTAQAGGSILDSTDAMTMAERPISVEGAASLRASDGAAADPEFFDVVLDNVVNDFMGAVSIEAEDARIADANDLILEDVALARDADPTPDATIDSIGDAAQFNFEVNVAAGALTHPSGQVVVARDTMITARDAVTLDRPADDFGGDFDAATNAEADGNDEEVSVVGPDAMTPAGAVTLRDVDDIVLGRVNVDSLDVTAGDDIFDDGDSTPRAVTVQTTTGLSAGGNIILDNGEDTDPFGGGFTPDPIHDFGAEDPAAGMDTHRVDATGGTVLLVDTTSLRLGTIDAVELRAQAGDDGPSAIDADILDTDTLSVTVETATELAATRDIKLDNGRDGHPFSGGFMPSPIHDLGDAGGDTPNDAQRVDATGMEVVLVDANGLRLGVIDADDLFAQAAGSITDIKTDVAMDPDLDHPDTGLRIDVAGLSEFAAGGAVQLDFGRDMDPFGDGFAIPDVIHDLGSAGGATPGDAQRVDATGMEVVLVDANGLRLGVIDADDLFAQAAGSITDIETDVATDPDLDHPDTGLRIDVAGFTELAAGRSVLIDFGLDPDPFGLDPMTADFSVDPVIHDFGSAASGPGGVPTDSERVDAIDGQVTMIDEIILVDRNDIRLGTVDATQLSVQSDGGSILDSVDPVDMTTALPITVRDDARFWSFFEPGDPSRDDIFLDNAVHDFDEAGFAPASDGEVWAAGRRIDLTDRDDILLGGVTAHEFAGVAADTVMLRIAAGQEAVPGDGVLIRQTDEVGSRLLIEPQPGAGRVGSAAITAGTVDAPFALADQGAIILPLATNDLDRVSLVGRTVLYRESGDATVFDSAATETTAAPPTVGAAAFDVDVPGDLMLMRVRVGEDGDLADPEVDPTAFSTLRAEGRSIDASDIDSFDAAFVTTDGDLRIDRFRFRGDLATTVADATPSGGTFAKPDIVDGPLEADDTTAYAGLALSNGSIGEVFSPGAVDVLVLRDVVFDDRDAPQTFAPTRLLEIDRVVWEDRLTLTADDIRLGHVLAPEIVATAGAGDIAKIVDDRIDFTGALEPVARIDVVTAPLAPDRDAARATEAGGVAPSAQPTSSDLAFETAEVFDFLVEAPVASFTAEAGHVLLPAALDGAVFIENEVGTLSVDTVAAAGDVMGRAAFEDASDIELDMVDVAQDFRLRANAGNAVLADGFGVRQTAAGVASVAGAFDIITGRSATDPNLTWPNPVDAAADKTALADVTLVEDDNVFGGPVSVVGREVLLVNTLDLDVAGLRAAQEVYLAAPNITLSQSIIDGELAIETPGAATLDRVRLTGLSDFRGAGAEGVAPGLLAEIDVDREHGLLARVGGVFSAADMVVDSFDAGNEDFVDVNGKAGVTMARVEIDRAIIRTGDFDAGGAIPLDGDASLSDHPLDDFVSTGAGGDVMLTDGAGGDVDIVAAGDVTVSNFEARDALRAAAIDDAGGGPHDVAIDAVRVVDSASDRGQEGVGVSASGDVTLGTVASSGGLTAFAGGAVLSKDDGASGATLDYTIAAVADLPVGEALADAPAPPPPYVIDYPRDPSAPVDATDDRVIEPGLVGAPQRSVTGRAFADLVQADGHVWLRSQGDGVHVVREDAAGGGLSNDIRSLTLEVLRAGGPTESTLETDPDAAAAPSGLALRSPADPDAMSVIDFGVSRPDHAITIVDGALAIRSERATGVAIAQDAPNAGTVDNAILVPNGAAAFIAGEYESADPANPAALSALGGEVRIGRTDAPGVADDEVNAFDTVSVVAGGALIGAQGDATISDTRIGGDGLTIRVTGATATVVEDVDAASTVSIDAHSDTLRIARLRTTADLAAIASGDVMAEDLDVGAAATLTAGRDATVERFAVDGPLGVDAGGAATATDGHAGAADIDAGATATARRVRSFSSVDLDGAAVIADRVRADTVFDATATAGNASLADIVSGGAMRIAASGDVEGLVGGDPATRIEAGGDLTVGGAFAPTPVIVDFEHLIVGGRATLAARDMLTVDSFSVGGLAATVAETPSGAGPFALSLSNGAATGGSTTPSLDLDALNGAAITLSDLRADDVDMDADGDLSLTELDIAGDVTLDVGGDLTLASLDVSGDLTADADGEIRALPIGASPVVIAALTVDAAQGFAGAAIAPANPGEVGLRAPQATATAPLRRVFEPGEPAAPRTASGAGAGAGGMLAEVTLVPVDGRHIEVAQDMTLTAVDDILASDFHVRGDATLTSLSNATAMTFTVDGDADVDARLSASASDFGVDGALRVSAVVNATADGGAAGSVSVGAGETATGREVRSFSFVDLDGKDAVADRVHADATFDATASAGDANLEDIRADGDITLGATGAVQGLAGGDSATRLETGGDLTVGGAFAPTPVTVDLENLIVAGRATLAARDTLAVDRFSVGGLSATVAETPSGAGPFALNLSNGAATGGQAMPSLDLDARNGAETTLSDLRIGDAAMGADALSATGTGDMSLTRVGVTGDAALAEGGTITLSWVDVSGDLSARAVGEIRAMETADRISNAVTIDAAQGVAAGSGGALAERRFGEGEQRNLEVDGETSLVSTDRGVSATGARFGDKVDVIADGPVTLQDVEVPSDRFLTVDVTERSNVTIGSTDRLNLRFDDGGLALFDGLTLRSDGQSALLADVAITGPGGPSDLFLHGFIGVDRSSPTADALRAGDMRIADFRHVVFGLEADAVGGFVPMNGNTLSTQAIIGETSDFHFLKADTLTLNGVAGDIVQVRQAGTDERFELNDAHFGLDLEIGLTYADAPANIDLMGRIASAGNARVAGLEPRGPRSADYLYNLCVIGDQSSCSTTPARLVALSFDFEPPEIFGVDLTQLSDVYTSFGNEGLWSDEAFVDDLDSDDNEELEGSDAQ